MCFTLFIFLKRETRISGQTKLKGSEVEIALEGRLLVEVKYKRQVLFLRE